MCVRAGMCSEPLRCLRDAVRRRIRRGSAPTVAARHRAESRVQLNKPSLRPSSSPRPCDKQEGESSELKEKLPSLMNVILTTLNVNWSLSSSGSHFRHEPVGGGRTQVHRPAAPVRFLAPASAVECLLGETQGKESQTRYCLPKRPGWKANSGRGRRKIILIL